MSNRIGPTGAVVSDRVLLIGGAAVLVLGLGAAWYVKHKAEQAATAAKDAAKDVADYVRKDAVNVTSSKNVATTAVNTLGQALGIFGTNDLTGQPNTLGSAIFEVLH